MFWRSVTPLITTLLGFSALAGCMVGPDYVEPKAPATSGYGPGALSALSGRDGRSTPPQRLAVGTDVPGAWWTLFHSRALNRLVEAALANNPDLEAAQAALNVARQNLLAQEGTLFPKIDGSDETSRQKAPNGGFQSPLLNQKNYTYTLFRPQVSVSYSPDIFGGARRQLESDAARTENRRFQLEATYLTLTSNVVLAAIQEASLRAQIDATQKVIGAQTKILDLYRKEFALGQIAEIDVVQQESAVAVSQLLLAPLQKQLAQQHNLLAALVGRLPDEDVTQTFTLASLTLPPRLPVSLPSDLVKQRPDVRAADALVQQASADVGVAVANRLPRFEITGNAGAAAISLAKLATPGAGFYTIAGTVSAPIFDAGTLFHKQEAAKAALDEAQAQYKSVVINAFRNVADALQALRYDAKAVVAAQRAEAATSRGATMIQNEFLVGAANTQQVLLAQQAYLSALVSGAKARADQYSDSAALLQALGGGWWNRTDVRPMPTDKGVFDFL